MRPPPRTARQASIKGKFAVHLKVNMCPASASRDDKEPPCHIERMHCLGGTRVQSVRRAAASSAAAYGFLQQVRRLECLACQEPRRGAGGTYGRPPGLTGPRWQVPPLCRSGAALPNPSLKARPNGVAPGPRGGLAYPPPRGPGATPSAPP